jgi:hypothetical protein
MQRREIVRQRPLFVQWPAWQQLPTEVHQQAEDLLANMCLEVIQRSNHQEPSDERPGDKDSAS